jgi:hypothetical protein
MRSRLALSALVVITVFAAPAIALAASGASSDGSVAPGAGSTNAKPGTTTGSATTKAIVHKGVARNPATDNDAGIGRGK